MPHVEAMDFSVGIVFSERCFLSTSSTFAYSFGLHAAGLKRIGEQTRYGTDLHRFARRSLTDAGPKCMHVLKTSEFPLPSLRAREIQIGHGPLLSSICTQVWVVENLLGRNSL